MYTNICIRSIVKDFILLDRTCTCHKIIFVALFVISNFGNIFDIQFVIHGSDIMSGFFCSEKILKAHLKLNS